MTCALYAVFNLICVETNIVQTRLQKQTFLFAPLIEGIMYGVKLETSRSVGKEYLENCRNHAKNGLLKKTLYRANAIFYKAF